MDWMSMIGMIGQVAGQTTGAAMGSMDQMEAMKLIKAAADEYGKIDVPKLQALVAQQMPDTKLAGIQDDPQYRDQQNAADAEMGDLVNSGGLTLADKAALNAIRNRSRQSASAGRNAIANSMAARGTLDSGSQLAMQLQGNQESANTEAQADESAAAQAQARAYQAVRDRARMASEGLDRTYRQKSDAARAQDAINAGNVAIQNTANRYNAGIPQQNFENQLKLAAEKLNPTYALAGAHAAQGKDKQQAAAAAGNTFGAGVNAAGKSGSNNTGGGLGYDEAAQSNVPAYNDNSPTGGTDWGTPDFSSGELSGESTKPRADRRTIVGYDSNGQPIYGDAPRGSNF